MQVELPGPQSHYEVAPLEFRIRCTRVGHPPTIQKFDGHLSHG
jgi:hypothetical protein